MSALHLSKSPLVESSFYVECVPSRYIDEKMVSIIREDLTKEFPVFRVIDDRRWRVRNLSDQIPYGEKKSIIAENRDKKTTIVIRSNYFSVSFRSGYTSWESFVSLALEYMDRYMHYAQPKKINKIGVRNINELTNLPYSNHPKAVLKEIPSPREKLISAPIEYILKDTQYYPECDLFATVVQSERPMRTNQTMSWRAIIDIDVFAADQKGIARELINEKLNGVRILKNQLFYGLIHAEILELLK